MDSVGSEGSAAVPKGGVTLFMRLSRPQFVITMEKRYLSSGTFFGLTFGSTIVWCKIMLPHVVVSQGLWWQDEDEAYQSLNTLTSQRLSDMGRGATFFSTRVDIEKV